MQRKIQLLLDIKQLCVGFKKLLVFVLVGWLASPQAPCLKLVWAKQICATFEVAYYNNLWLNQRGGALHTLLKLNLWIKLFNLLSATSDQPKNTKAIYIIIVFFYWWRFLVLFVCRQCLVNLVVSIPLNAIRRHDICQNDHRAFWRFFRNHKKNKNLFNVITLKRFLITLIT